MGDGAAAFLSGEAAGGLIPGGPATGGLKEALKTGFVPGALQNGGGYALGRLFNEDFQFSDIGTTVLNGVTGGFAGSLGNGLAASLDKILPSSTSKVSAAAAAGKIGLSIFSSSTIVGTQNSIINNIPEIHDKIHEGEKERCQSVGGTADC